jgi:hypothetical protein
MTTVPLVPQSMYCIGLAGAAQHKTQEILSLTQESTFLRAVR